MVKRMGRTPAFKTRTTCDRVAIRKNRHQYNTYVIGKYFTRTSTIGLRLQPDGAIKLSLKREEDADTIVAKTLLHEVTHWAQYLYMDRYQWCECSRGWQGIPHGQRLLEKIAEEIAQTWSW